MLLPMDRRCDWCRRSDSSLHAVVVVDKHDGTELKWRACALCAFTDASTASMRGVRRRVGFRGA
jgi:hypothetical protein